MKLQELITDRDGRFSPHRVQFHLWNAAILTLWIMQCIQTKTMAPLDPTHVMLLGVNNGTFAAIAAVERKNESIG